MLHTLVGQLSRAGESSAYAGSKYEPLGRALVFRLAARSLHVVGDSPLAADFRRLVTAGAVSGWDLHPVPAGRTPLRVLVGPLHRLSGHNRFYNLLEREGFGYVEEVAVTPEACLLEFRNSEPRFVTAVRQVLSLQMLAGAALADGDLPRLAQELIDELEERRRLILTSRTFAPTRRTYDSLAAELGIGRARVRQLETSSLRQLADAAAHDRYRPLRWRAASVARPDGEHATVMSGAPPWLGNMLSWLAGRPA
jgi:hypothetical protein